MEHKRLSQRQRYLLQDGAFFYLSDIRCYCGVPESHPRSQRSDVLMWASQTRGLWLASLTIWFHEL